MTIIKPLSVVGAIALSLGLLAVGKAEARSITFIKIADTSGPFSNFDQAPAINNSGTVAFKALLKAGGSGIFTGSGDSTTTIADTNGTNGNFSDFGFPTINNSGKVAFQASLKAGGSGIFTGSGTAITTIADTSGDFKDFLQNPAINNSGTVAFQASLKAGGSGVFTGSGRAITTIANTSGSFRDFLGTRFEGDVAPAINNKGTVAFWALLKEELTGDEVTDNNLPTNLKYDVMPNYVRGIFTNSGGAITTIADNKGDFASFGGSPAINNNGTVAFLARGDKSLSNPSNPVFRGIYTYSHGVTNTIVDNQGDFYRFGFLGINDSGTVVFSARLDSDSGPLGIFTGSNPVTDKVIATGDTLFGAKVTDVVFFNKGLNNSNQIAFSAKFENGTSGIFRADLTEN